MRSTQTKKAICLRKARFSPCLPFIYRFFSLPNRATTLLYQNKRDKNSNHNSERVLAWWVRAFHADRRIPLRWIPTLTLGMTRGRETRTRCGFVITDCFDFIQTAISIEYLLAVVPSQSVGVFTKGTRLRAFHSVLAWGNATQ